MKLIFTGRQEKILEVILCPGGEGYLDCEYIYLLIIRGAKLHIKRSMFKVQEPHHYRWEGYGYKVEVIE